jgi:hypothetical protein
MDRRRVEAEEQIDQGRESLLGEEDGASRAIKSVTNGFEPLGEDVFRDTHTTLANRQRDVDGGGTQLRSDEVVWAKHNEVVSSDGRKPV